MPNIGLEKFMVFDSSKGDEGLIYHWTKGAPDNKVSLTEQIDDICLCDASINISQLFSAQDDLKTTGNRGLALTFEKTIVVIVEVEPILSIWMAAHVAPIDVPIDTIERFICNTYDRFCLLNGTFNMIGQRSKSICEEYFNKVLQDVHLNSIISNVASLYNYILYLDINLHTLTLMKVNSFINQFVCINAEKIRHTIVIFNDQLLWSSLGMHDTRLLYNYLVSVLIRAALQEELSTEVDRVRRIEENMPIYLTDNCDTSSHEEVLQMNLEKYYMTVFRSSNNMTLGIILNEPNQNDFIQKCEELIPLASLAQSVGQNFLKANSASSTTSLKYVLINRLNLSIDIQNKEHLDNTGVDTRLLKYLVELEPELRDLSRQYGSLVEEFYGKTSNDSWLTVTNSKYRTVYSVHNVRNSGLTEAAQVASNLKSNFANSRR